MSCFLHLLHVWLLFLVEQVTGLNPRCPPLPCGILGNISFPFTGQSHPDCGLLVIDNCNHSSSQQIQLGKDGPSFYITEIRQDNSFVLRQNQNFDTNHCSPFQNLSLSSTSFYSFEYPHQSAMFNCSRNSRPANSDVVCNESSYSLFYHNRTNSSPPTGCSLINTLVNKSPNNIVIHNLYTGWFSLQVSVIIECHQCFLRGGKCLTGSNGKFNCSGAIKGIKLALGSRIWHKVD